jgi:hypothetical protein
MAVSPLRPLLFLLLAAFACHGEPFFPYTDCNSS